MRYPDGYHGRMSASITFRFDPRADRTSVVVFMTTGLNRTYQREDLYRGTVPVVLADLHGLSRRQVVLALSAALYAEWNTHLGFQQAYQDAAAGLGVPLGTTGGTVAQDPLPGL